MKRAFAVLLLGWIAIATSADEPRQITATKKYLNLPVKNGAPKKWVTIKSGDKVVRMFDIELAEGEPDWWAFLDLAPFKGQTLSISTDKPAQLEKVYQADEIGGGTDLYHEALRPQFHFTAKRGWNNDPNGLVFYKGEYHLFYQHNPYGWNWGNMHWGHAVSSDLVHWKELDEALYPDELGTMFSGSAVVDEHNTAGFQKGREKTLVAFYTAAGGDSPLSKGKKFSQCLAYSNDRGRTWTKYTNNPVLPHIVGGNRDPKVLWYEPEKKWLMALYLDKSDYEIFESKDLKTWSELCKVEIPGTTECPEFFEMPIEGTKETRWIFYGGNGRYLIGKFDGKRFTPESGPHDLNHGNCFYASQTYNLGKEDPRRILVPWSQINIPGMPFNQMIGLPVELKLKHVGDGLHLTAAPVKELERLRYDPTVTVARVEMKSGTTASDGQNFVQKVTVTSANTQQTSGFTPFETQFDFDIEPENDVILNICGVAVKYLATTQELTCLDKKARVNLNNGKLRLRMLVDRTSIDIFANDGDVYMPMGFIFDGKNNEITISGSHKPVTIPSMKVFALSSIWDSHGKK